MKLNFLRTTMLVLMIAMMASCGLAKPSPSNVVKTFFRDVEAGKIQKATNFYSDELFQRVERNRVFSILSRQTRVMEQKGGIKSIDTTENISGDLAKVKFVLAYNDDSTEKGIMDMIKVNGHWKMLLD